jgi:hypothetical protein
MLDFLKKNYSNYNTIFSEDFTISYVYKERRFIGKNIDKYLKFKTFAFDNYENKLIQKSTKKFGSEEEFLKYINSLRIREYILNATECYKNIYDKDDSDGKLIQYTFYKSILNDLNVISWIGEDSVTGYGALDYEILIELKNDKIQNIQFEFANEIENENEFSIGLIRILNSIRMVDRDEFLEYIPSKGICYWNQKKICLSKSEMSKQLKGKKGIYHLIFYRNEKDEKNIHKKSIIQPTLREIIMNTNVFRKISEEKLETEEDFIKFPSNIYFSVFAVNTAEAYYSNKKIKFTPISMEYTCTKHMKCYIQSIVFNR